MTDVTTTGAKVGVAFNPMGYPHYTDHLAAVAVAMDIPLVFTDVDHYEQALRLYPGLKVEIIDWQEINPRHLVEHYDVLFVSEMWSQEQLKSKFYAYEKEFDKRLRVVHCPHGFSDKGFWFERCLDQDITLVYGQNMLDLIASRRPDMALQRYVVTGNLRSSYYQQHKATFDKTVATDVLSRFARQQSTILYAPTWRDTEQSTSFFDAAETLFSQLPTHYNLLVKLHPNLEHDRDHMARVYEIIGKYEDRPNIVMLSDYPLIYPVAAACDIYIGDRSAVGYDFLGFRKPMFFLNQTGRDPARDRNVYLYRCGTVVTPEQYDSIFTIIEETLPHDQQRFGAVRQEVYEYTFGLERPFDAVRTDINRLLAMT